jgi:1-pyrroline-5-carboxylate dehydrogenase
VLEGFIAAISPFNFTAIGGNLAYAPAIMVLFKLSLFKNLWMFRMVL